jgi:DNA ligase-1
MDADDRFVYHKLIRGGFRVGVQKKLVSRALAGVAGVDDQRDGPAPRRDHRAHARGLPRRALGGGLRRAGPRSPAVLSRDARSTRSRRRARDPLGDPSAWQAEWKYDGVRAQLVRRGGAVAVWSRGEELVTHQFPELVAAARGLPRDAVLDGEILIWTTERPRRRRPAPFADLQTRLNRKAAPSSLQPGLFESTRLVMLAFDLLELDGDDLRDRPQHERRALLEDCLSDHAAHDRPTPSASPRSSSRADRGKASPPPRAEPRPRRRGPDAQAPRRALRSSGGTRSDTGWFKWKIDPFTIDCVMVSAQPGSGRRASLYTDYTFAVRAGDAPDAELVTFAKAYSGLTQDEIETLDRWIRANTTRRTGPFRAVEPEQVFELAFEGVQASARHKAGLAVRFPRISRWRTDKPAAEIDTLDTLRAMIPERGDA